MLNYTLLSESQCSNGVVSLNPGLAKYFCSDFLLPTASLSKSSCQLLESMNALGNLIHESFQDNS